MLADANKSVGQAQGKSAGLNGKSGSNSINNKNKNKKTKIGLSEVAVSVDQQAVVSGTLYYDVLGIKADAPQHVVKKARDRAMAVNHPDRGGSQNGASLVGEAYATLSTLWLRTLYDTFQHSQYLAFADVVTSMLEHIERGFPVRIASPTVGCMCTGGALRRRRLADVVLWLSTSQERLVASRAGKIDEDDVDSDSLLVLDLDVADIFNVTSRSEGGAGSVLLHHVNGVLELAPTSAQQKQYLMERLPLLFMHLQRNSFWLQQHYGKKVGSHAHVVVLG